MSWKLSIINAHVWLNNSVFEMNEDEPDIKAITRQLNEVKNEINRALKEMPKTNDNE